MVMINKILLIKVIFSYLFGITSLEFPFHPHNLGKWNGGSAINSTAQQVNPASIIMSSNFSISSVKVPGNISAHSIAISRTNDIYIVKFNISIIDYGEMFDFVTQNEFSSNDLMFVFSTKTNLKNLIL